MARMRRDDVRAIAAVLVDAHAARGVRHMLSSSARQVSQVPQPTQGNTMRRSPTFTPLASGPSLATRPTTSWPIASGST
jgi:hypothetical protein